MNRLPDFQVLRTAFRLLWSELDGLVKARLAFACALTIGTSVLTALAPIAFQLSIDGFARRAQPQVYLSPLLLIVAYVASQFLSRAFGELRILVQGVGDQRLQRRLSSRLFSHILTLPLRLHLERQSGAVGQVLIQGLQGYQTLLSHLFYTILPVSIQLATMSAVLVHLGHPVYLAILAAAAVSYLIAFSMGAASIAEPIRAASSAQRDAHGFLTDSLINYETVKYFNSEKHVSQRYDGALSQSESHWRRFYQTRVFNGVILAFIFAASLGVSLLYAGHDVLRGAMTVGEFVLVNTYVAQLMQPLETIGYVFRDLSQAVVWLEKMIEILLESPESDALVDTRADSVLPVDVRGELSFEEVSFSYRLERSVLREVSFSVPAGRTIAIVGLSGSGKSTVIRLLFRLYPPDSGQILLDGRPITEFTLSRLRQSIAIVPQDTVLFNDTIGHNIAIGRPGSSWEEIEQAARLAHLHEFGVSLPEGYATRVGERGIKLSGGEKQRVSIARAALKRPRIFVFDEATSSLDSRTEREIMRNLREISRCCTTLVIAHRLSTIVHADEILVLEDGAIVERGTHGFLLGQSGGYARLWEAQQQGTVAA